MAVLFALLAGLSVPGTRDSVSRVGPVIHKVIHSNPGLSVPFVTPVPCSTLIRALSFAASFNHQGNPMTRRNTFRNPTLYRPTPDLDNLEDFRGQTIARVMSPNNAKAMAADAEESLLNLLYFCTGRARFDYWEAVELIEELNNEKATVGDFLDGKYWPKALRCDDAAKKLPAMLQRQAG